MVGAYFRRRLLHVTTACFVVLCGASVATLVDPFNANYSDTWVDLEIDTKGSQVRLERTYNSRSLFDGIFGFGWCSDFETRVRPYRDGTVVLTNCGAGDEAVFRGSTNQEHNLDA